MTKWEYDIEYLDLFDTMADQIDTFNDKGKEGWRMISVVGNVAYFGRAVETKSLREWLDQYIMTKEIGEGIEKSGKLGEEND